MPTSCPRSRAWARSSATWAAASAPCRFTRKRSNSASPSTTPPALRHLADIHQDAGAWSAAEPLYEHALRLYRADPSTGTLELANALRPYALLRERLGDGDAAVALWREARALYLAAGIAEAVAECDRHLD
jgi:tetratricopeptide (TPR) repeat protein